MEITVENFTAAMEAVVEARPNYVYPIGETNWSNVDAACLYVRLDKPEPGCIIGATLHKLGVPLDVLRTMERLGASAALGSLGVTSYGLRYAATGAQGAQDNGATWGEALQAYHRELAAFKKRGLL